MVENFKNLLKKNKYLYGMGMLVKYRNDEEYYNKILNKTENNFSLQSLSIHPKSNKTYYLIEVKDDKVAGFFAMYRLVLSSLVLADSMGWIPYVNIENSLYNVPGGYNGKNNMFEYYFRQTCSLRYSDLKSENVIRFERKHSKLIDNTFFGNNYSIVNGYDLSDEYLDEMARCLEKYIRLDPTIELELENEIVALLCGKKTVGVHIRGTDYNKVNEGHPVPVSVLQYKEYIDSALDNGFEQIFLACDEKKTCDYLNNLYKEIIVFYDDVFRSETSESVHSQIDTGKHNGYTAGREVLRDMLTLASCDGIISGLSQVSICARIQRRSYNKKYCYDEIIDLGKY